MGRVAVYDAKDLAKEVRETFHDSPVKRELAMPFGWPKTVVHIGTGRAVVYWSDKWKKKDTYKHVAEAYQDVYMARDFRIRDEDGGKFSAKGEVFDLEGPMPKHFAYLGRSLGLQVTLKTGRSVQIDVPSANWGAAKSKDGEVIVFMYTSKGVQFLIVGDELDVEKDGIVG